MIQTRVPWLSGHTAQTSFLIEVCNYRINTSGLRDLTPWSRVLEKVIVSRFINKFPTTNDDELLYPSFQRYLTCLLLHRNDQLPVAGAWVRLEAQRGYALRMRRPECFSLRFKTYNVRSYECQSKWFRKTYKSTRPIRGEPSGDHGVPTAVLRSSASRQHDGITYGPIHLLWGLQQW
jgi:hypothetical protein